MATVTSLPNGAKSYMGHGTGKHQRSPRKECKGWTKRAAKGNRDFLFSVEADQLTGNGYALTLTVRDCPESAADWHKVRRAFVKRLERAGMHRLHWVTEWQRRGHPHLHGAIWLPDDLRPAEVIRHWIEAARKYRPHSLGQDIRPITANVGWFEYLAKHAARGVSHYQRNPDNIPPGWQGQTGRVWGHLGDWPTDEGEAVSMNDVAFFQYRRLLIRYCSAKAKRQGDLERAKWYRRRLHMPEDESRMHGLGEWIPKNDNWALIACALGKDGAEQL